MDQREVVFIDANIFLEVMLNNEKSASCELFLNKIKKQEITAATSDFLIYASLLQIQYKLKSIKVMQNFLIFVNSLNGLDIIRPSLKEMDDAIRFSEKYTLDFDDAFIVSCMINNNIKTLISFDTDFDKVPLIKRQEP